MFETITNLDELRKAYRAAAFTAHPDHGGSTEQMQEVNAAYEKRFTILKNEYNARAAADTTGTIRPMNEMPSEFISVVTRLINIPGLIIELCGSWLWISGETRVHKDEIKAAGCFWSKNKSMWYWRCAKDSRPGWHRGGTDMATIRHKYGSERITSDGRRADALPA